mmetsp:Transcript_35435/g.74178  ORF Transcript_35435/g.74178 Transcript_35435/m.74178 type:complete len:80 (+) Transcript_35435:319-558(+)
MPPKIFKPPSHFQLSSTDFVLTLSCMIGPLSIWSESSSISGMAKYPLEMWQGLGNFWTAFAPTTGPVLLELGTNARKEG